MSELLSVENLTTHLATMTGVVTPVDNVSFKLERNRTLALVGESGSGKSMTCLSMLNILPPSGRTAHGRVLFKGEDMLRKSRSELEKIRGREVGMILQDPMTSLNPLFTIGTQVGEVFRYHRNLRGRALRDAVVAVLEHAQIPAAADRLNSYPHEFSGGMRQRVAIAINVACGPDLLIADEPTTALDVTVQLQILRVLKDLQSSSGMAMILVTHDLHLVERFADEVAIMYAGRIVEQGPVAEVFARPGHPYTRSLLAAIPRLTDSPERLRIVPGQPPSLDDLPPGCRFAERCPLADDRCRTSYPDWSTEERLGYRVACWKPSEALP